MSAAAPIIPHITKISKNIVRILGMNPGAMTLQGTNTYLVGSGRKRILIDAGDPGKVNYIENLKGFLRSENALIDKILITHWHHDHIGGVKDVLQIDEAANSSIWKFPRSDEEEQYDFELHYLRDEQEFKVDGITLKIFHTPGHSTDHVVLTIVEEDSLFSGDCILGEGTAVFEDLFDYMKSLDRIMQLSPKVIYPGHGNLIDDPVDKIKYYINHRQQRESQILDVLKQSPDAAFSEMDIVEKIYVDTPKELHLAAAYNVNHHLKKLTKEGKADVIHDNDGSSKWKVRNMAML